MSLLFQRDKLLFKKPSLPIIGTNLVNAQNLTGATSYVTASISPKQNQLVLVSVYSFISATLPNVPTITGASGTWTQVATIAAPDNIRRVTMFRDLSHSPGSGALTIDFAGQTQGNAGWTIDQLANVDISGTHGSGAVVQSLTGSFSTAVASLTITLAAFKNPNNVGYGFLRRNQSTGITRGAGFTDVVNFTTTNIEIDSELMRNNKAVKWTFSNVTAVGAGIAAEIRAAA